MNWSESIIKLHIYTFPESSSSFSFSLFIFFFSFNSVQYSVLFYCSEILASWAEAWLCSDGSRGPGRLAKLPTFVFLFCVFFFRTRVVGHLSSLPCNVLKETEAWVADALIIPVSVTFGCTCLPVANLFLLRESLYPLPSSSMSTPDRVLPSLINCTARVEGFEGPFDSSNLALRDPAPGVKHKQIHSLAASNWSKSSFFMSKISNKLSQRRKKMIYLHFQTFLRCRSASTDIYFALNS